MAEKDTLDLEALTRKVTTDVMLAKINQQIQGKVSQYATVVATREAERWYRKNKTKFLALVEREILLAARTNRRATQRFMSKTVRAMCKRSFTAKSMHIEYYNA